MWFCSLDQCCGGPCVPFGLVGQAGNRRVSPPWGPVPWSRVLSGSLSPVLDVAAVSSSSSAACAVAGVVALAATGVVAWRGGRAGGLRGSVLGGSLGGCSPSFSSGPAVLPLCGVRWSVGLSRCSSCGVKSVVRRHVLAGVRLQRLGVGRCWSFLCGVPFLSVRPGARRCALSLCATAPGPSPSSPFVGYLPLRCVAPGALSLCAPASYLGPLLAASTGCPFPFLASPLPLAFP